ncbi:hypothetical protein IMG5_054550 [Ichthyophthirius multifiliis]|uniref:Acyl-CoA oxidase n=1 Tax=Ichthyophthirius multifiliis TaxID=5932 RepID=G0QN11_ICHMU|nr:hypothetical protein IMG5_054550 [Ichthyophthirius multifiliis]EGR33390.1 hypothetical protein IMG5_054550 [Ichthyophthirius multifiliis]|eukprot:XP_004037376.1 hypothetical protein IMG5_054550 [Ichthyophthirius multifiliis]
MSRLADYKNQFTQKATYIDSAVDYLNFQQLLNKEDNDFRLKLREFLQLNIAPTINEYVESAEFPEEYIPKLKEIQLLKNLTDKPYGNSSSILAQGVLYLELSRCDPGLATFVIVQHGLLMSTINQLGSQEQKDKYLPLMRDLELTGGWGLTEFKNGSDATSIQTTVKSTKDGWVLNGDKRWIGNGNRDIMVVWARNIEDNNKIQGFLLNLKTPGVHTEVIKHKLALRIVQNCQLNFQNVFIPKENYLVKATDFSKGTSKILLHSRILVCWLAAGIAVGVYDHVIKYISERKQFGKPVSSFQLQQEKLVRIMGYCQSILLMCWRVSTIYDQGKATLGQATLCKAFTTSKTREIARLGREMFGGNGIIIDNYVMKALADIEALYTYEGTYDINSLVAARELTGVAAFKVSVKQ